MNSARLQLISNLIDSSMQVIDIGTDHAYLPIMLAQKGNKVMGSDIHEKALSIAFQNLQKHHLEKTIPLVLSDGLSNINPAQYNTLVIAGMGFHTIKHILANKEKLQSINTIFLQSNNNCDLLRQMMNENGWLLAAEFIIEEKKHLYHILKYQKGQETLTNAEILVGKWQKENQKYYAQELAKIISLLKKIPKNNHQEQAKLKIKKQILEKYCTKE